MPNSLVQFSFHPDDLSMCLREWVKTCNRMITKGAFHICKTELADQTGQFVNGIYNFIEYVLS